MHTLYHNEFNRRQFLKGSLCGVAGLSGLSSAAFAEDKAPDPYRGPYGRNDPDAGRRYAQGRLSEWAWRRARTAAHKMVDRADADTGCFSQLFFSAACAAGWCTGRDSTEGVYWALIWAAGCADYGHRSEALERYCDELVARLLATE